MGHLVAVDLETSGLDPNVHEIIEVGLVWVKEYEDRQLIQQMEMVLPFDESRADPKALEINGWGKREFGPTVDPAWARDFMVGVLSDAHLVGKNPASFDARFLERFLNNAPWHHRMVDVGAVCMGRFRLLEPPKTAEVEELTGIRIPENKRHSALADARWAWDVLHWVARS